MIYPLVCKVFLCSFLCTLLFASYCHAEESIIVKHFQQQARYEFGLKVLDLALSKLGENYQIVGPDIDDINEGRGELLVIEGQLDLQFMSATIARDSKMIPIRIPIYQGLLGLRLLLIKPELNPEIKQLRNVEDLRKFVGGHGAHWGDIPVYAANNLPVITTTQYANLFEMLKLNRFDYFHRGVNEIWDEVDRHLDDLMVADNIMLYYPQPVYFYVGKHRPVLAKEIEQGLLAAIEDGSYQALFQEYYEYILERAKLNERTLIVLKNPAVPAHSPKIHSEWWISPDKLIP